MMRTQRRWLWVAAISASLGLGAAAMAQSSGFQPFKGLFGAKSAPQPKAQDDNYEVKIQVELAWLADPITFPYYLEAQLKGGNLEVHGYVPSKLVRTQALSLAKLNCPLTVVDTMKEHPSLAVHPIQRAPEQLKSSAQTALCEALPGQKLSVQCQADGTIQVTGPVRSLDQKLKVSQALRRLHGCTSVTNLTQTPAIPIVQQAPPAVKTVAAVTVTEAKDTPAATAAPPKRGFFGFFNKTPAQPAEPEFFKVATHGSTQPAIAPTPQSSAKSAPTANTTTPIAAGEPYETRGLVMVTSGEMPKAPATSKTATAQTLPVTPEWSSSKAATATPSPTAAQLKKRIEAAVPGVRDVTVTFKSKTDVRIECTARSEDSSTFAGQILSLPELRPYKPDLQIQLPEKK